ncbi:MAG: pseudouridine synthase [Cyanophyceae cyanobacterium]
MTQRVQKILSQWGIASRRQAEQMILAGRVRLNGSVVTLGQKADPNTDCLEVDGKAIALHHRPQLVYLLLNKPKGYVSTCIDPHNRPTVMTLLPASLTEGQGVHPVGRLDRDSTGALLLTNDGELTQKLTHPRYHLPKTYQVWVAGQPTQRTLYAWSQGVLLDNRLTLPAQVKVLKRKPEKTLLQVILTEGRNRQIRRVAQQLGFPVLKLHRTAIGKIRLQAPQQPLLPSGQIRFLTADEIAYLKTHSREEESSAFGEQWG